MTSLEQTKTATPLPISVRVAENNSLLLNIKSKEVRLARVNDTYSRLLSIIEERARYHELGRLEGHPNSQEPGVTTGLLVQDSKSGDWRLDTPLLRELRELEKQVSSELGEWQVNQPPATIKVEIVNNLSN